MRCVWRWNRDNQSAKRETHIDNAKHLSIKGCIPEVAGDVCYGVDADLRIRTTVRIGKEAKDMMKKVMLKLRDQHPSGIPTPSEVGLDSHWGATSFKSHWTQKFATLLAKNRSKVVQEIRFARKTKEWGLGRQHS